MPICQRNFTWECPFSMIREAKYFTTFNNYSMKSRWIVVKYLPSRESGRYIFLKPLFTEIEENNCFSIYTRSDLATKSERKPLKSAIWLTDKIARKFKNTIKPSSSWHVNLWPSAFSPFHSVRVGNFDWLLRWNRSRKSQKLEWRSMRNSERLAMTFLKTMQMSGSFCNLTGCDKAFHRWTL